MLDGRYNYEKRTMAVMRSIALFSPLVLTLYGLLIEFGVIKSNGYSGFAALMVLMIAWSASGVLQYMFPARSKLRMLTYLGMQHVFAICYIVAISGFSVAFISCWALLYLASYIYFSYIGFFVSFILLLTALTLSVASDPSRFQDIGATIAGVISTGMVGLSAVLLNRIREYDREEIIKSRLDTDIQKERMLTLVNNLADAIVSTDRYGNIQVYNAAFASLVDTNVSVYNRPIDAVAPIIDSEGSTVTISKLLHQASSLVISDEYSIMIGAEKLRLEITYTPIRSTYNRDADNVEDDGYLLIFRDVTKAKSLEEERDEFISVVSHELRTPIAIAEGSIDNARVIFERDPAKTTVVASSMTMAHEQVLFLARMVNDLSTLSRAERGVADEAEDIDVMELAHELHADYTHEAKKKGLHLELELGATIEHVFASRLYLHELLQNFITNAIKYTKKGSITLKIGQKDGLINFSVSDTGIGISKADQKKIFDKFYRSEDYRTRETGGTGLGLYVAEKLAKKLGCSINVVSRLNHGSTFSFALPVKETED